MPKLIGKFYHIRPRTNADRQHINRTVRYISTRDGVEIPARGGYVDYMATRNRSHGLFGCTEVGSIKKLAEEISQHKGVVWTPILSLKREDAARLGYDNAAAWESLLRMRQLELAAAFRIKPENFRWYASFHNEGNHPHCHMVCYSTNPKEGFLTEDKIGKLVSTFTQEIFRNDLQELYQAETSARDRLTKESQSVIEQLCQRVSDKSCDNPEVSKLLLELQARLVSCKGKKVYAYLPPDVKSLVDAIVDELAKDNDVQRLHELWFQKRCDIWRTYKDTMPEIRPLSHQPEFKHVKNAVVKAALTLDTVQEIQSGNPLETANAVADFIVTEDNGVVHDTSANLRQQCAATQATFLLRSLAKIFQQNHQPEQHPKPAKLHIDGKRLRALSKQRKATGQAMDDHHTTMQY